VLNEIMQIAINFSVCHNSSSSMWDLSHEVILWLVAELPFC